MTEERKKLINYLLEFGFNEKEIIKLLIEPSLKSFKKETLLKNITEINDFFIVKKYNKKEIIKMVNTFRTLYSYSRDNLEYKINNFLEIGYTKKNIMKMTIKFPNTYSYSPQNIKDTIKELKEIGYKEEEIIKMTKKMPQLLGYSIESIKQRIKELEAIGYTKENIIYMTKIYVKLYSISLENIKQKIEDIMKLGFIKEEVLLITKINPGLLASSTEKIKEKIDYLREINLEQIILTDPNQLIQSVELTYARYEYFKSIELEITKNNYRLLFLDDKIFKKRYNITKQNLKELYPYLKYHKINSKIK